MGNIFGFLGILLRRGAVGGSPDRVTIALHNKFTWGGAYFNRYLRGTRGTIRRGPKPPEKGNSERGQQSGHL